MIEIRDLKKSYGRALVVDGVSLTFEQAGVTGIIGPNGAGKSTLLSIIGRLLKADAGSVHVEGLDVTRTGGDVIARRLALLRQDNHVTARLTVGELVAFGRYPHSGGRQTLVDRAHIERAIHFLGLEDLRDRFLDELSGGQRQRAFVAMVLCQDTRYMLFDEPLNNLDIRHAVAIMTLIRRAARELGKTVIIVLHDINVAAAYCDRILAMKDGRVVRHGPPGDIMVPELLSDIYETPVRVYPVEDRLVAVY